MAGCHDLVRARCVAPAAIACAIAYGGVQAELLSTYFPPGVPGYGEAPGVTVAVRARPEYDSLGTRLGSFVVQPQLGPGARLRQQRIRRRKREGKLDRRHPPVAAGQFGLVAQQRWRLPRPGRLALPGPAAAEPHELVRCGRRDLAVGRDQLTVAVAHLGLHQDRTELDALPTDAPVAYQVDDCAPATRSR